MLPHFQFSTSTITLYGSSIANSSEQA
uniref:Uncharacterized protein n=1 Tax=Rhizophora mucronata TaxID=61149 RepID=A0A2P2NZV7_RHIMU